MPIDNMNILLKSQVHEQSNSAGVYNGSQWPISVTVFPSSFVNIFRPHIYVRPEFSFQASTACTPHTLPSMPAPPPHPEVR